MLYHFHRIQADCGVDLNVRLPGLGAPGKSLSAYSLKPIVWCWFWKEIMEMQFTISFESFECSQSEKTT